MWAGNTNKESNDMKTAKYKLLGGKEIEIEYDEMAPCIICGYPVIAASMAGTDVCPWCDSGYTRPETGEVRQKTFREVMQENGKQCRGK
jgi:hypothetical protein